MRNRWLLLPLVLILALLAAACGGSDDGGEVADESLTTSRDSPRPFHRSTP